MITTSSLTFPDPWICNWVLADSMDWINLLNSSKSSYRDITKNFSSTLQVHFPIVQFLVHLVLLMEKKGSVLWYGHQQLILPVLFILVLSPRLTMDYNCPGNIFP